MQIDFVLVHHSLTLFFLLSSLYGRSDDIAKNADIAEQHKRGWRDTAYLLLEFPESSTAATRISQFSIVVIMFSILSFMLESCPGTSHNLKTAQYKDVGTLTD